MAIIGGGQSGLAAADAAVHAGLHPLVFEAGPTPAGSWPRYYDSLTLFSPARYSEMPGAGPFDAAPDTYPGRDAVAAYLERYAAGLDVEIRTGTTVAQIDAVGREFLVHTREGDELSAAGVVSASGSFANPHLPRLPGMETFTGTLLHVSDYRSPKQFGGERIVVVGGGNSAVQVGYELGRTAQVTLATRAPLTWMPQCHEGKDVHYWLNLLGFDDLPVGWFAPLLRGPLVVDDGSYGRAEASGVFDRRPMFAGLDGDTVLWSDGQREHVDAVVLATGYRPSLGYLRSLGALSADGLPLHTSGISSTHAGLVYVGLEFQRSFSSNTLRGVRRDADYVMGPLAAHAVGAVDVLSF